MKRQIGPSDSPVAAVKHVIADLEGCRPEQLGTLDLVIDTDELNAFTEMTPHGSTERVRSLVFQYCGYSVAVYSDRFLHVES